MQEGLSLDCIIQRMKCSQWPTQFGHYEWLQTILSQDELELNRIALLNETRVANLQDKVNTQCSCILSFSDASGPFGFLLDVSNDQFLGMLALLTLYIHHCSSESVIVLAEESELLYADVEQRFSVEGMIYRNVISPYVAALQKRFMVSFGRSLESISNHLLAEMGWFCFRTLLHKQVPEGFMNTLRLRLDPKLNQISPFQYSENIACKNTKMSFLLLFLSGVFSSLSSETIEERAS